MPMVETAVPRMLELVVAFANTRDVEDATDVLETSAGLSEWLVANELADSSLAYTVAEIRHAISLRDALRAHLLANNGEPLPAAAVEVVEAQARRSGVAVSFGGAAAQVVSEADGVDGALGAILVAVAVAMFEGTWARLKVCKADDCRWAFVDRSRNQSRSWCAMGVCGNREKVRAYRARQR
jgi:predicted RNA-binding Zn ribbon-like protein